LEESVLSFGKNDFGQTGHGNKEDQVKKIKNKNKRNE